ncbi:MAG: ribosome biogenesis factor YjgA [Mariprofundaceae bacterium]
MSKLIDTSDMDGGRVERLNKSQQKREIQALLELGKKLIELDELKLVQMHLPAELHGEIMAAKSMKHGARKRQIKLITKLLRELPTDSMVATFEELDAKKAELDADFHRVERWRDRLLSEGPDTLTEFMHAYPNADASQIRQLIRNAAKEARDNKPPRSSRALFKLLRDTLQ